MKDNKIYIALCDDEMDDLKEARAYLDELLKKYDKKRYDFIIHEYTCGEAMIKRDIEYHMILQDVEMPRMNGFEVAREMEKRTIKPKVIFLTNHMERADESLFVDTHRYLYLYKPINKDKFHEAISSAIRIVKEVEWIQFKYIDVTREIEEITLSSKQIFCIESLGKDRSCVYTETDHYVTKRSVAQWLKILPCNQFVKTSKVYLVNVEHARPVSMKRKYTKNLSLTNGMMIDVSRDFIKPLNEAIFAFSRKRRS